MFDVGGGELMLIVIAILLLFGPEKLPELARTFGKGMSHLRKAQTEFQRNVNAMADEVDELVQKQPDETPAPPQSEQMPKFERSLVPSFDNENAAATPFEEHSQHSAQAPITTNLNAELGDETSPDTISKLVIRPAENTIALDPK